MEFIEKYIKGKSKDESECEDDIYIGENGIVAVIDGVTSQKDFLINGKKGGKTISTKIVEILSGVSNDISLENLIYHLNTELQKYYKSIGLFEEFSKNILVRPACSLIIYSKFYNQLWLIGDCVGMIDGNVVLENKLEVDILATDIRLKMLNYFLTLGITEKNLLENDISTNSIRDLRIKQQSNKNKQIGKYSYSIIDGFDTRLDLIRIYDINKEAKEIVLATDGYPKVFGTLLESELYLKMVLDKDPLCYKIFKNFKGVKKGDDSFDDRAYIRFNIQS